MAYQRGLIPVSGAAIERAIELNGVAVDLNKRAFAAGRGWAVDPAPFAGLVPAVEVATPPAPTPAVSQMIDRIDPGDPALRDALAWRLPELIGFGGEDWANRYADTVARVRAAEAAVSDATRLTTTVATHLCSFMTYKDEYEVARLHRDPSVLEGIRGRFGHDTTISYRLKPPTLTALGYDKKIGLGRRTGAVTFGALRRMRRLRGTFFDPFGHTAERRMERDLIDEYEALVAELLTGLTAASLDEAVHIAGLADRVRGYGHVKLGNVAAYRSELQVALTRWRGADSRS